MALEEAKNEDIEVLVDGFNFAVESDVKDLYGQFTVDYSDSWLRKGFVVYPKGGSANSGC